MKPMPKTIPILMFLLFFFSSACSESDDPDEFLSEGEICSSFEVPTCREDLGSARK